jgi:multiple antibiotic resistance protein
VLTSLPKAFGVAALTLFPIINPIGNLPAFFALTVGDDTQTRRRQAVRTAIYVTLLLVVFTVVGRALLHALGISLPALQIAGGLVVGHSAYGMVTAGPKLSHTEHQAGVAAADVSFSPMAMPLLSGPGAIGSVIALASRSHGVAPIVGIVIADVVLGLVVAGALIGGGPLLAKMGETGIAALTRIFGFLILAIAVELLAHGVLALAPGLTH